MNEINDALRIEKMVAELMRGARDDKVRLETKVDEQEKLIAALRIQMHNLQEKCDDYQQRAAELATRLSAVSHIITGSIPNEPRLGTQRPLSDHRENVATDRRPQVLDRPAQVEVPADLDSDLYSHRHPAPPSLVREKP